MQFNNSNTASRHMIFALLGISFLSILMRTVPAFHLWPNFSPIGALALFSGAILWNKKWMFVFPIGAMLVSDTIKEIIAPGTGFYPDMVYVYVAFFGIILLGSIIRSNESLVRKISTMSNSVLSTIVVLGIGSLAGSVLFFLVSNFGAWMANTPGSEIIYARNFAGLIHCYAEGVPFFRYTMFSDLIFNAVFFGGFYLVAQRNSLRSEIAA